MVDLNFRQEPIDNQFKIRPNAKNQQITLTYYTSFEDGFKEKILDFMTFEAPKQRVLLNGKESLMFDALRNGRSSKIKITKNVESKCESLLLISFLLRNSNNNNITKTPPYSYL